MHRAGLLLLCLALAWSPGQARESILRWWLACGLVPCLVWSWFPWPSRPSWPGPHSAPDRPTPADRSLSPWRWLPVAAWSGLVLQSWLSAAWSPAPGAAWAVGLTQFGWLAALVLGLLHAPPPAATGNATADASPNRGSAWPTLTARMPAWAALAGMVAALPGWFRPGGTFGNPDLLAGFLVVTLCWSWQGLLTAPRRERWGWCLAIAVQLIGLGFCQSWGAWLALAGSGWAWGWLAWRRVWRRAWVMLWLLLPLLGGLLLLHPTVRSHLAGRVWLWRIAGQVAQAEAPWGTGAGRLHGAFLETQADLLRHAPDQLVHRTNATHAHQEALQVLAEQGVVGLLCFLLPWLLVLSRPRPHGSWAAVCGSCVLGCVSLPMYEPATAYLTAFSLGWSWSAAIRGGPGSEPARSERSTSGAAGVGRTGSSVDHSWQARGRASWRPLWLIPAVLGLLLGTGELIADRLLAHGAHTGHLRSLGWSSLLALHPARALQQHAALQLASDPFRAGQLLEQAIRLDPSPTAFVRLGQVALHQREPARAIPPLQQAVRLNPRLFAGHFNLARAYEEVGDRFAARRHATRARSLRPADPRLRWLPQ